MTLQAPEAPCRTLGLPFQQPSILVIKAPPICDVSLRCSMIAMFLLQLAICDPSNRKAGCDQNTVQDVVIPAFIRPNPMASYIVHEPLLQQDRSLGVPVSVEAFGNS